MHAEAGRNISVVAPVVNNSKWTQGIYIKLENGRMMTEEIETTNADGEVFMYQNVYGEIPRNRNPFRTRGRVVPPPFNGTKRNEPCPCGSGRKFKKCCNRIIATADII